MTNDLTAKDFKDDLLVVLRRLTELTPDKAVRCEDIYPQVCEQKNITAEQFGLNPSSQTPWVEKWIQWAFKELSKEGLTKSMGRGLWALTKAGTMIPVKVSDEEMPMYEDEDHPYAVDPYLRGLAVDTTPCFSYYSDSASAICSDCPLKDACQDAKIASLSILAKNIEQHLQAQAAKKSSENNPSPDDLLEKIISPSVEEILSKNPTHESFTAWASTTTCTHCGKPIQKGTRTIWSRDVAENNFKHGQFHPECYVKEYELSHE